MTTEVREVLPDLTDDFSESMAGNRPPTVHLAGPKPVLETQAEKAGPCCEFGIVNSPPLLRTMPLYQERLLMYQQGVLEFCACDKGQKYQHYIVKQNLEAGKDVSVYF